MLQHDEILKLVDELNIIVGWSLTEMTTNRFPKGWNQARVRRVLSHYEKQTDQEAAKEDDAAFKNKTVMQVPRELVPLVRVLIGEHLARTKT